MTTTETASPELLLCLCGAPSSSQDPNASGIDATMCYGCIAELDAAVAADGREAAARHAAPAQVCNAHSVGPHRLGSRYYDCLGCYGD